MKLTKKKLIEKIEGLEEEIEDLQEALEENKKEYQELDDESDRMRDLTDVFSSYLAKIYRKNDVMGFENLQDARHEADCLKSLYPEL